VKSNTIYKINKSAFSTARSW